MPPRQPQTTQIPPLMLAALVLAGVLLLAGVAFGVWWWRSGGAHNQGQQPLPEPLTTQEKLEAIRKFEAEQKRETPEETAQKVETLQEFEAQQPQETPEETEAKLKLLQEFEASQGR